MNADDEDGQREANGRLVSDVVVYDDISESKQQEEERLQALIDSSPVALVEFGPDTSIPLSNPAAERIFGREFTPASR